MTKKSFLVDHASVVNLDVASVTGLYYGGMVLIHHEVGVRGQTLLVSSSGASIMGSGAAAGGSMEQDEGRRNEQEPQAGRRDPTHGEDGVDLTLIRWMLALPPGERLATLERTVRSILRLRNARFTS